MASLAAVTACPVAAQSTSGELFTVVAMHSESWGFVQSHWILGGDGVGEFWRVPSECGDDDTVEQCMIPRFSMKMHEPDMAAFTELAERLRVAIQSGIECGEYASDDAYGKVTWVRGSTETIYHFDNGCQSDAAGKAKQQIAELDRFVESHAAIEAQPCAISSEVKELDLELPKAEAFSCPLPPSQN